MCSSEITRQKVGQGIFELMYDGDTWAFRTSPPIFIPNRNLCHPSLEQVSLPSYICSLFTGSVGTSEIPMHFDRAHLPFLRPMSFSPAPSDSISFPSDSYDFPPTVDNDSSLTIHPKQESKLNCNKTPLTPRSDGSSPLVGNRTQLSNFCTPWEDVSFQFPTGRTSSSSLTPVDLRECLYPNLRTMLESLRKPALH
jgi:hypothetical protein